MLDLIAKKYPFLMKHAPVDSPVPPPEFTAISAAAALKTRDQIDAELAALKNDQQKATLAFEQAHAKHDAECRRVENRRRELCHARDKTCRAEQFILASSERSAEELALEEQGRTLLHKVAELHFRYGLHASVMQRPEKHKDVEALAKLEKKIADCEASIKRQDNEHPDRWAGHSCEDLQLPKLLRQRDALQLAVDRYRTQFARWQEIQATKADAQACFAERTRLREERESAVIAEALKSVK